MLEGNRDLFTRKPVETLHKEDRSGRNATHLHRLQKISKTSLRPVLTLVCRFTQIMEALDKFEILSFAIGIGQIGLPVFRPTGGLLDVRKPEVGDRFSLRAFFFR